MKVKDVRQWETIVSLKDGIDTKIFGSIISSERDKWLIIGLPFNLQGEMMFHLVEYNENMNPVTGIFEYVVSESELLDNFEIVGKYKRKY